MSYLFEVSWQVCNKFGGVSTVICSKAYEAIKEYGLCPIHRRTFTKNFV